MIAVVTTEARFFVTPDGKYWTPGVFSHGFWTRYLEVFDGVRVVARVHSSAAPPENHVRVDGIGVTVAPVPGYLGSMQYLCAARAVRHALSRAIGSTDAVIMRVPSHLANCLSPVLRRMQRPYGVVVVGDPWDVFAPGVIRHPLRPLLRRYFTHNLLRQCSEACAGAYVTQRTLQQRYPLDQGTIEPAISNTTPRGPVLAKLCVGVSDVEIAPTRFPRGPRTVPSGQNTVRLVQVGSLAQLYKGPDVALEAVAACLGQGLDLHLTIIGDGKFRLQLAARAKELRLGRRVVFCGQIPAGEPVRAALDQSDLFIMPSRTEGLPRAMIEAMARGLPCIGSAVGGIPELLPPEDTFPPGDAAALAARFAKSSATPRMQYMSARNLQRSRDFRDDVLRGRRAAFFQFVRARTEDWLRARGAA